LSRKIFLTFLAVATCSAPMLALAEPEPPTLSPRDVEVLTTVLTHFAARKDTWPANPGGYIAIEPKTAGIDWLLSGLLKTDPLRKFVPAYVVADLAKRNAGPQLVPADLAPAAQVRIQTQEEVGDFLHGGGNHEIATLITPYAPGYSTDGTQAVVVLSFNWAVHTGYVIYKLRLKNDRWSVVTSHIDAFL
jgi:hypothetical protein